METNTRPLAEIFLARRPSPPTKDAEALESMLAATLAAARREWPGVTLSPDVYVRAVAERAPVDVEPQAALEQLRTTDIYLAVACAGGDAAALEHFDRAFVSLLPAVLSKASNAGTFLEDVRQLVRQRLLVGDGGPPRVATYAGRGSLEGWFRAAALRLALNLMRAQRVRPLEVELARHEPAGRNDAESALARARHRDDFQASLRVALAQLTAQQRMLLRWHFFETLPLSRIALLLGVNKSTVSRWLTAAREEVLTLTRQELQRRLGVPSTQMSSLVRVLLEGANATLTDLLSRSG